MLTKTISAVLVAAACSAAPAFANHGVRDAGIDERQHRLEDRIEEGRRSGALTRPEYRRLRDAMRHFERVEHSYRSDGYLTPRERYDLHARLESLSREVYREGRDGERRHGSYNYGHYSQRPF